MAFQQGGVLGNVGAGPEHHGPQGTEYTLQGQSVLRMWHHGRHTDVITRRDALPPDRMAQPRAGAQCLGH